MEPLIVFEHSVLPVNDVFHRHHWRMLALFNERHDNKYFTVLRDGIKFNQYVGVIQVEDLQIEILPKISRSESNEEDKKIWQNVLIEMLQECRWLHLNITENTSLSFVPGSLLEAYIAIFLNDCEALVRRGLIKRYMKREENSFALKGKLLFDKHLRLNFNHEERFYTSHQTYDKDHLICQILYSALKRLERYNLSSALRDKLSELLFLFPELSEIRVTAATSNRIVFNRKTEPYRQAVQTGLMLLLNLRPDLSTGDTNVLALMFDMNVLWEEYIARQLFKVLPGDWKMDMQDEKTFWRNDRHIKGLRPDILISVGNENIVIDTKWKVNEENSPSDADLRQIFAYCHGWNANTGILLYPAAKKSDEKMESGLFSFPPNHECDLWQKSVIAPDQKTLNENIGSELIEKLRNKIEEKRMRNTELSGISG